MTTPTPKPLALELAELMETFSPAPNLQTRSEAAAELRRQHQAIVELREALRDLLSDTQHSEHHCGDEQWCPVLKARATLTKQET
jgi:hypothetical protein